MTQPITENDAVTPQKRKADGSVSSVRKKTIACVPCHARKVKCSGGKPCTNCARSRVSETCIYPERNQKVTLTERELDRLVAERVLEQQRATSTPASPPDEPEQVIDGRSTIESSPNSVCSVRNPLFDDGSWFEPFQAMQMPIHIGEASDSAFATRFRQAISSSAQHIPRTQYVSDTKILSLSNMECIWPPLSRARLLVKVALRANSSIYHCVRRSEILEGLEKHYRTQPVPGKYFTCKLLALFAIGEAYSTRTQSTSEDTFPGLNYFSRASRILRESNERPQVEVIECMLLLGLYSLLLNRRHSAYQLASSAVRQAIIIGLQQNMPEPLSPDRAFREHCVRIWWTVYTLDRQVSSKVGYPTSIQDDDITVDPPSKGFDDDDFTDTEYLRANIRLATLSKEIISSLYSRKSMHVSFAKRVQDILIKLQAWVEELPSQLRMNVKPSTCAAVWLHLSFNQHIIMATRPILLHNLRTINSSSGDIVDPPGGLVQALAEACLRAARHSCKLLTDAWIDGSFATFDYTYTQCLFSVAVVLAISSLLTKNEDDHDNFLIACGWIHQLSQSGNFAAMEWSQHLSALQSDIISTNQHRFSGDLRSGTLTGPVSTSTVQEDQALAFNPQSITPEMALAEPFLQDFLMQTDLDVCFNIPMYDAELQSLYL